MSFADQALAAEFLMKGAKLNAGVHAVPVTLDREVARLKLEAIGVTIDAPTATQAAYLAGWRAGT